MSYQPNIPQSNQLLSISQLDLLTNFTQLNGKFGVDHVPYSPAVTNSGKHNKATLVAQGSDPATAANEGCIYSKLIDGNLVPVYRDQSNGAITPILSSSTAATNGQVNIGAIIVKWGQITFSGATPVDVTFSPAFPTNCFNVQVTPALWISPAGEAPSATDVTVSGFKITTVTASKSRSFYWLAIGN